MLEYDDFDDIDDHILEKEYAETVEFLLRLENIFPQITKFVQN